MKAGKNTKTTLEPQRRNNPQMAIRRWCCLRFYGIGRAVIGQDINYNLQAMLPPLGNFYAKVFLPRLNNIRRHDNYEQAL